MATTADSYSVKRAPAKAPVSTHPVFPAIAALWFAALLGIGSLVLPVALIERFVSVTGLAELLPSAAPPLGFTARAGIALSGAVAGALVGLALARKVAQAHAPEPRARPYMAPEARQCRPILAHDELGEEGLGSAAVTAQTHKRRALASVEDDARSTYLPTVPTPGLPVDEPAAVAELAEDSLPPAAQPEEAEAEPLELADFAEPGASGENEDEGYEIVPAAEAEPFRSRIHAPVETMSQQDQPMTDRRPFDIPQGYEPASDADDPLPFEAPSLRRAGAAAFDEEGAAEPPHAEFADEAPAPHLSIIEDAGEPGAIDDRPLAELGLVQLAARLGASLARRKARQASSPPAMTGAAIPPLAGAEDFEAAEAEEAARAIADFFASGTAADTFVPEPGARAPTIPAPLQAWSIDADDDTDDDGIAASFSLPLTKASAAGFSADDEIDEFEEPGEETEYSSLLAMKNPFVRQQEFVRVEEPEDETAAAERAVTFPSPAPVRHDLAGREAAADLAPRPFDPPRNPAKTATQAAVQPIAQAGPQDPGEAERNLRAALATLQRMSGAA